MTLKPSKRILLVEDNEANIELIQDFLMAHHYSVTVANTGLRAIDSVKSHSYDLILMDVQMPEMDGLEATRRIRQLPNGAEVPIFALTSFAMSDDRERCLLAGMNEYMSKPLSLKELLALIERYLQRP